MAEVCLSAQRVRSADGSDTRKGPLRSDQHLAAQRGTRPEGLDSPPEVKSTRRCFTAEYKLRILLEADQCSKPGELGALLQREGLYSSHLCAWRRQREAGALAALSPKKRGRKAARRDCLDRENQLLHRENQHLQARLRQAEMIIAMQTKVSDILGIPLSEPDGPADRPGSTQTALLSGQQQ